MISGRRIGCFVLFVSPLREKRRVCETTGRLFEWCMGIAERLVRALGCTVFVRRGYEKTRLVGPGLVFYFSFRFFIVCFRSSWCVRLVWVFVLVVAFLMCQPPGPQYATMFVCSCQIDVDWDISKFRCGYISLNVSCMYCASCGCFPFISFSLWVICCLNSVSSWSWSCWPISRIPSVLLGDAVMCQVCVSGSYCVLVCCRLELGLCT